MVRNMRILSILALLLYVSNGQISCDTITEEYACSTGSGETCKWVGPKLTGMCKCKSEVKLDILFGVDTSGSIGWRGFQIQKQFISKLVTQGLNNGSRIGFTMFGTEINESRSIQAWDTAVLEDYVDHIFWTAGWTNTPALITSMLASFESTKDPDRQQIFIMITDGNPCLSETRGGCPQSVCGNEFVVKNKGIRTIVIGVGDGLKRDYVDCLCIDKTEDFIPVDTFSTQDFNSIMSSLSAILCPVSKNCLVTEVKAMRRPPGWDKRGDGRFTRFLEIYNDGIDFDLHTLRLSGLVNMAAGPRLPDNTSVNIAQGTYLVFYDAADKPVTNTNAGIGPSVPSCHLCGPDCSLADCAKGDYDYCFCSNAVYVRCGNYAVGDSDTPCPANDASKQDSSVPALVSVAGCGVCNFNNDMDASNWYIEVTDATTTANIIDEVVWGQKGWWFTTEPKYSYELINRGSDNNLGDSWASSCSPFGTPGAGPAATCDEYCTGNSCQVNNNGGTCLGNGNCDCNPDTGYYPSCTPSSTGGVKCAQCLRVPSIGDCDILWVKNGTTRYAAFNWSSTTFAGRFYRITYFPASQTDNIRDTTDVTYWTTTDYDPTNTSYGGYVQSCITQCIETNNDTHPIPKCNVFCSESTMCDIRTSAPTEAPTPSPTAAPTDVPSPQPTQSPTLECPRYWWVHGTQQAICQEISNSGADATNGERCGCSGGKPKQCCLAAPDFNVPYDVNRAHQSSDTCKLDVQFSNYRLRYVNPSQAGVSPGYLLTTDTHIFNIDILPADYPCTMDLYWRLEFDCIDTNYVGGAATTGISCANANTAATIESAGLEIDVTEGYLRVWSSNDLENATVTFTVTQAVCDATTDTTDTTTRRRLPGQACDAFDSRAISGNLVIVNATSQCQPDCADGRIYPMRIPIWYNYAQAFIAPPSTETELPAWLWWLVAALVVFLALLAFLLYRYWWKNKKTGAALGSVQADLDAAVMEMEDGFGAGLQNNAVGFNPLATGFNPNAAAGNVAPNAPPNGGGNGPNFIRPNVEKQVFREEFGQKLGNNSNIR